MSPIALKKTTKLRKVSTAEVLGKKCSKFSCPKGLLAEFDVQKPVSKAPPVRKSTLPPTSSGRSKTFKPLLLRSKPSTEGFKMPKARSKQVTKSNKRQSSGTIVSSSILQRTGRISSAVFLKRIQQSICLAPDEESFDEIEMTKERKQALVELKQPKIKTLSQFLTPLKSTITKVGEGAFGEVFMAVRGNQRTIIKVILILN